VFFSFLLYLFLSFSPYFFSLILQLVSIVHSENKKARKQVRKHRSKEEERKYEPAAHPFRDLRAHKQMGFEFPPWW